MLLVFTAVLTASGCGQVRHGLPVELLPSAEVVGFPGVRGWDDRQDSIKESLTEAIRQGRTALPNGGLDADGAYSVLSISGGGANGAFGAGHLCGWSDSGTRPSFRLVTGISTGALIAPFAFLGSAYDPVLKRFYTNLTSKDVFTVRPPITVLFGAPSVADTAPLAGLLEQCVDEKLLAEVAQEHQRGRRLFVGTTNIDAGRLVVWDMGAIASSGRPGALALFRKVMLASASVPIAFPPQYFSVEAGGGIYDEMHVDGGVLAQVFLYGVSLNAEELRRAAGVTTPARGRLYVIRNGQVLLPPETTAPRLLVIAERSVTGLLNSHAVGDIYRLHALATRDDMEFHLASIPPDFKPQAREVFDREDMNRLFDLGYGLARQGYPWERKPPGLESPGAH